MTVLTEKQYKKTQVYTDVKDNKSKNIYIDTDFEDLARESSKPKGAYFEQLVEEVFRDLCSKKDFDIKRLKRKGSEYDRHFVIEKHNIRFEIKGSFLWKETKKDKTKKFKWQQIRPQNNYTHMLFLGVYPKKAVFYYCTKEEIVDYVMQKDKKGEWEHAQHGGKKNPKTPDTFWIAGQPSDFPFMKPLGDIFEKELS